MRGRFTNAKFQVTGWMKRPAWKRQIAGDAFTEEAIAPVEALQKYMRALKTTSNACWYGSLVNFPRPECVEHVSDVQLVLPPRGNQINLNNKHDGYHCPLHGCSGLGVIGEHIGLYFSGNGHTFNCFPFCWSWTREHSLVNSEEVAGVLHTVQSTPQSPQ